MAVLGEFRSDPEISNVSMSLSSRGASLHAYMPARGGAKMAVLVVPGGSYRPGPFGWCKTAEGSDIARWLATEGIAGVVLHYRMPVGRPLWPLSDALEAIAAVRDGFGAGAVPPMRTVGIMGFSAGGHLAALASTRASGRQRPDFSLLVYPVISLENHTHVNSRREFLGPTPSAASVAEFSADRQVTSTTPPAFLVHARDDRIVSYHASRMFFDACTANAVRCTFVILEAGGHPFANKPRAWVPARQAALLWVCATLIGELGWTSAPGPWQAPHACTRHDPAEAAGPAAALRPRLLALSGVAAVLQTERDAKLLKLRAPVAGPRRESERDKV